MPKRLSDREYICPGCGHIGRAAIKLRGSNGMERLLWYLLLIPGPLYSYWRRTGKQVECAMCQDPHPVLIDSKLGELMLKNQVEAKLNKKP